MFMSPSSFTRLMPPSLPITARIFPPALSARISSFPSSSMISILCFLVWMTLLSETFFVLVSGGRRDSSRTNPSATPSHRSAFVRMYAACVPTSGSVHGPCPSPACRLSTGSHALAPPAAAPRYSFIRPFFSRSRLSTTMPTP